VTTRVTNHDTREFGFYFKALAVANPQAAPTTTRSLSSPELSLLRKERGGRVERLRLMAEARRSLGLMV
jgi:hypothetical protein